MQKQQNNNSNYNNRSSSHSLLSVPCVRHSYKLFTSSTLFNSQNNPMRCTFCHSHFMEKEAEVRRYCLVYARLLSSRVVTQTESMAWFTISLPLPSLLLYGTHPEDWRNFGYGCGPHPMTTHSPLPRVFSPIPLAFGPGERKGQSSFGGVPGSDSLSHQVPLPGHPSYLSPSLGSKAFGQGGTTPFGHQPQELIGLWTLKSETSQPNPMLPGTDPHHRLWEWRGLWGWRLRPELPWPAFSTLPIPLCTALLQYQMHFCRDKQLADHLVTSRHIRAHVTQQALPLGSCLFPSFGFFLFLLDPFHSVISVFLSLCLCLSPFISLGTFLSFYVSLFGLYIRSLLFSAHPPLLLTASRH